MSTRRILKDKIKQKLELLSYASNQFVVYSRLPVIFSSYPCFVIRNSKLDPNRGNYTQLTNNKIRRGYDFNIDVIFNLDNINTIFNDREKTLEELEDLIIDLLQSKSFRDGDNIYNDIIVNDVSNPYDGMQTQTTKDYMIQTFNITVDVIVNIP